MGGDAAFYAGDHPVLDTDVRKGAPHHHLMVAAAGAVGVEVGAAHLVFRQVFSARRVQLDGAGGGDVVGGDGVAENGQRPRVDDVAGRHRGHRHPLEIRRVGNVGGAGRPAVSGAADHVDALPADVALVDVGIARAEHVPVHELVDHRADLVVRGPDVLQVHGVPVLVVPDRLRHHVADHASLDRICDDERRRCQIIGAHVR